eukprot:s818_g1.t1
MYDFNDCVGADLLHHHDSEDQRHTFLSIVDWGTSYHVAVPLKGLDSEDIEKAFNDHWVVPFGPPKRVSLDLDGAVQKGICRLCDWHDIMVQNMSITADEVHLAASMVSSAKNELRRRCGHSPTEWVFGRHPRLPEPIADPDGGQRVSWDVTPESQYQRAMAVRTAARIAFHHSQGDNRLRKALLQRARTAVRPMEVGETVHFWTQPKNRRRGRWTGPAVIVGREGDNYWISRNGRCRLTAAEHLRPSGPEEVGEYLRMKGAQAEVEKLLEADFDDENTFDAEKFDTDDDMVDDVVDGGVPSDCMDYEFSEPEPDGDQALPPPPPPARRLKRKTRAEDIVADLDVNEAHVTRKVLTQRGVEKRQEKELKWNEIPSDVREKFKAAEATQWQEHLDFDALEPLSIEESRKVLRSVSNDRILRSRWAYKDKNWAQRKTEHGEELFLYQPTTGFAGLHHDQLVRVKKNIFGLATSPHEWWQDLQNGIKGIILDIGGEQYVFDQCPLDPCVFPLRRVVAGKMCGRPVGYVASHVDDLLVIASRGISLAVRDELSKVFPVDTWEEGEFTYLGSEIKCGEDSVMLRQRPYIEDRLFTVDVPKNANEDDIADADCIADNRSLIGALSWVSAQTRPDLTCAVSMAQQLQKCPTYGDVKFTNSISMKATREEDQCEAVWCL